MADFLTQYGPLFLQGFGTTLILSVAGFVLGFALGVPISFAKTFGSGPLKWLAAGYVEVIRGTPMLVQLFIIYYSLPQVGINLDALTASIVALGLNSAAYQAEYFRGAMRSVPAGQMEAALSVGMTRIGSIMSVVFPQSLRLVIPAWTNELVYLVQYSSIAYLVTVEELTGVGTLIGSRTFQYVTVYGIIALIYLATTLAIVRGSRILERRYAIPGLSASSAGRSI
ncbi:MAG TPA: amino acid ABC transporter permease [Conexivisphaerales archaeon]|nr:amino acid ABC transporter permease [Conexivisphaerales archaeon]